MNLRWGFFCVLKVITFYEPLKPFMAIVIEVTVLVAAILLYEKSRSKKTSSAGSLVSLEQIVQLCLLSFILRMCVIFRKWGQRPSQHTVSVATTSDFLDFSYFQLVYFCVLLRTPGENDASESNSSVRHRKMWRLESSTRSTFPLLSTFQVQLESVYACQHWICHS